MKKLLFFLIVTIYSLIGAVATHAVKPAATGFDEFGYNNVARNFVGTCASWHMGKFESTPQQAEAYCGPYSNDILIMKWNSEWDRGNEDGWSDPNGYNAWIDNQWIGQRPNGTGETWHYKIAWDAGCVNDNTPTSMANKGTASCVWGSFAMLQSHGTVNGEHVWDVLLAPAGYGSN